MRTLPTFALALLASISLAACSTIDINAGKKTLLVEHESTVVRAAYSAADFLVAKQKNNPAGGAIAANGRGVLVSTIVDINDLDRSNALGRLLSEQISSRLSQHGVAVNELKLRGNLYVSKSQGELLLSREIKDISATQNADFLVTGTYAVSTDSVYVTVKLLRATDSRVLNAFNFNLAKSPAVSGLLNR